MGSHLTRLRLLIGLTVAFLIGAVVLFAMGLWSDAATGVFGTALGLLVPAVIDASAVDRRRRTPGKKPVEDDVE